MYQQNVFYFLVLLSFLKLVVMSEIDIYEYILLFRWDVYENVVIIRFKYDKRYGIEKIKNFIQQNFVSGLKVQWEKSEKENFVQGRFFVGFFSDIFLESVFYGQYFGVGS